MPRDKDSAWNNFKCFMKPGNTREWGKCKTCGYETQGILSRLKKHIEKCNNDGDVVEIQDGEPSQPSSSKRSIKEETKCSKRIPTSYDSSIIVTTKDYKEKIDLQLARFFYATNTSFRHADHPEFKKLIELLRPGYKSPSRFQISNNLLDKVHEQVELESKELFLNKTVTMALDGWSNVHNDPIVGISIVDGDGNVALVSSVDTSGNPHSADYLLKLANSQIEQCESQYGVNIGSFVTDNAANVTKMRKGLSKDIIQYGCSAHFLQLLSRDLMNEEISEKVNKIIKYFRNHHQASFYYKEMNGKELKLPSNTRWNSVCSSISSFLASRGNLVQICQVHRTEFPEEIHELVNNPKLAEEAEKFVKILKPISVALDRIQRDKSTIAVAVEVWYNLEKDLSEESATVLNSFMQRRDMALGAPHYLANLMDHRFKGIHLTHQQCTKAYDFLVEINPDFLPIILCHKQSTVFPKYLYNDALFSLEPVSWWKSVEMDSCSSFDWKNLRNNWIQLCEQLLTSNSSTAGLERIFSTFGLVQSKLRNRLGNEKASKLTFIFKSLNQKTNLKRSKLEFSRNSTVINDSNSSDEFE